MRNYLSDNETYILIPGVKTYKTVSLVIGKVETLPQSNNESEKISDLFIRENGKNHLLFRIENRELTFFITSKCNHRCIMCPQKLDIDPIDNDLCNGA